jgi:hypothetical protein
MAARFQQALGLTIGTAVGGVIYGIFLQALLFQSLLFDRRPLDPAQWREHLSARAWVCGTTLFAVLLFTPLRFLTRHPVATVLTDPTEGGVAWFLITVIFLIQIATVRYATMRPELCMIEHPRTPFRRRLLRLWKNWIQLAILGIEFIQLFAMASAPPINQSALQLLPPALTGPAQQLKSALWQLGTYDAGFGLLCGFGGLYILLCGIFIAFDLTVDSPLSPLLFTLLAGGFYGTITSGLLSVILYSTASTQVIVSLLMLAYYSSTAVFVSIYRSDAKKVAPGEIQLMPVFTATERVSKGILAAVSVAAPIAGTATTLVLCILMIALLAKLQPYSITGITMLRIGSIGIAGWTALVTVIASSISDTTATIPLTVLLVSGWVLIPPTVGIVAYLQLSRNTVPLRAAPPPEEIVIITPLSAPTPNPESSAVVQSAAP